jgi:hypothetical protein
METIVHNIDNVHYVLLSFSIIQEGIECVQI